MGCVLQAAALYKCIIMIIFYIYSKPVRILFQGKDFTLILHTVTKKSRK